jgi:hypothetical protein
LGVAWQEPPAHWSLMLQGSPSLHTNVLLLDVQVSFASLQLLVVQTLPSSQFRAWPTQFAVALQASLTVQKKPSLQTAPWMLV